MPSAFPREQRGRFNARCPAPRGGRAAPCSGRGAPGATSLPPPAAGTGLRERLTPSSVAGAWPRIKLEPGAANPTPGRAAGEAALVHVADISGHQHHWRCREPHGQAAPPRGFAPGQTHVHPSLLSPRSPRSPTVPPGVYRGRDNGAPQVQPEGVPSLRPPHGGAARQDPTPAAPTPPYNPPVTPR